jgi:hypothetical protein
MPLGYVKISAFLSVKFSETARSPFLFVAQHLLKIGAHLVTAGPPACAQSRAKKQPGGGKHAGEKGRGGAEKRKKLRVDVWHGIQEMLVVRARVSRTGKKVMLPLLPHELLAPFKSRWVWAGVVIFASATCPLQFA